MSVSTVGVETIVMVLMLIKQFPHAFPTSGVTSSALELDPSSNPSSPLPVHPTPSIASTDNPRKPSTAQHASVTFSLSSLKSSSFHFPSPPFAFPRITFTSPTPASPPTSLPPSAKAETLVSARVNNVRVSDSLVEESAVSPACLHCENVTQPPVGESTELAVTSKCANVTQSSSLKGEPAEPSVISQCVNQTESPSSGERHAETSVSSRLSANVTQFPPLMEGIRRESSEYAVTSQHANVTQSPSLMNESTESVVTSRCANVTQSPSLVEKSEDSSMSSKLCSNRTKSSNVIEESSKSVVSPSSIEEPADTPASSQLFPNVTQSLPVMDEPAETSVSSLLFANITQSPSFMEESTEVSVSSKLCTNLSTKPPSSNVESTALDSHPLFVASIHLKRVALPVLVVVGTIGNILVVAIHYRLPTAQKSSMAIYLTALAVSDTLALWSAICWVLDTFGIGVVSGETHPAEGEAHPYPSFADVVADAVCRLRVWIAYAVGEISAWLLVAMTMHRTLNVVWPIRTRGLLRKRNTRIAVALIVCYCALTNAHIFYGHSLLQGRGKTGPAAGNDTSFPCNDDVDVDSSSSSSSSSMVEACFFSFTSEAYGKFFNDVWVWMDAACSALLPFVLLSVTNSVLVWNVGKALREARDLASENDAFQSRDKRLSSMTVTLIIMSVAFFLLALPVCVYMIVQKMAVFNAKEQDVNAMASLELIFSVAIVLWYTNFAINFYLYCLTGAKYRAAFWSLCRSTYPSKNASIF